MSSEFIFDVLAGLLYILSYIVPALIIILVVEVIT